jgi:hypothetical protein
MKRRSIVKLALISAIWLVGTGHTPYRQWAVYRKKHLLILTDKTRPGSFELGRQLTDILAEHLPESKARVTRAPYLERIASLISSGQLEVALMVRTEATALATAQAPFTAYPPVALRVLIGSGDFVLVCRADFPDQHAYLVSKTLLEHADETLQLVVPAAAQLQPLAVHPGTLAYQQGLPLPQ